MIGSLVKAADMLQIRGDFVPLLRLNRMFGIQAAQEDPTRGLVVLVETENGRVGLVIDEMLGQQQVVIKSLESNYRPIEGVSGATILGDGRVALILDVSALAKAWENGAANGTSSPPSNSSSDGSESPRNGSQPDEQMVTQKGMH